MYDDRIQYRPTLYAYQFIAVTTDNSVELSSHNMKADQYHV
jgi:hypothetical protein